MPQRGGATTNRMPPSSAVDGSPTTADARWRTVETGTPSRRVMVTRTMTKLGPMTQMVDRVPSVAGNSDLDHGAWYGMHAREHPSYSAAPIRDSRRAQ